MDCPIDSLLLIDEVRTKTASVVLRAGSGSWRVPEKKSSAASLDSSRPHGTGAYWWGCNQGKHTTLVREAVQLVDCSVHRVLSRLLEDGKLLDAKVGPAVLRFAQKGEERWFGPVALVRNGQDTDPTIPKGEPTVQEIEATASPITVGRTRFLPPDWTPAQHEGALSLIESVRFYGWLAEMLESDTLSRIEEANVRLPSAWTRLAVESFGDLGVEDAIVRRILAVPAFERANRKAQQEAQARADALIVEATKQADRVLADMRREEGELRANLQDLRQQKRDSILAALADVTEDDQALAIIAALGQRSAPASDLSEIERQLSRLAERPVQDTIDLRPLVEALTPKDESRIDLEPLVRVLQERPKLDLAPLVELIRGTCPAEGVSPVNLPPLPVSEVCLNEPGLIEETVFDPTHRGLLIAANAGFVGIVVGERAPETLLSLSRLAFADRAVWWPVPGDIADVRRVLDDPLVGAVLNRADEQPERLFGFVLEGVDRAPTESYLEPLLVLRDLRLPLPGILKSWPRNLLLFATTTRGGRTSLPVSPGVWERSVPLPSSPEAPRPRRSSEIDAVFWAQPKAAPTASSSTQPRNGRSERAARSAAHLGFGAVPACLAQGLSAAECLATDRKPNEDVRAIFPTLFA